MGKAIMINGVDFRFFGLGTVTLSENTDTPVVPDTPTDIVDFGIRVKTSYNHIVANGETINVSSFSNTSEMKISYVAADLETGGEIDQRLVQFIISGTDEDIELFELNQYFNIKNRFNGTKTITIISTLKSDTSVSKEISFTITDDYTGEQEDPSDNRITVFEMCRELDQRNPSDPEYATKYGVFPIPRQDFSGNVHMKELTDGFVAMIAVDKSGVTSTNATGNGIFYSTTMNSATNEQDSFFSVYMNNTGVVQYTLKPYNTVSTNADQKYIIVKFAKENNKYKMYYYNGSSFVSLGECTWYLNKTHDTLRTIMSGYKGDYHVKFYYTGNVSSEAVLDFVLKATTNVDKELIWALDDERLITYDNNVPYMDSTD